MWNLENIIIKCCFFANVGYVNRARVETLQPGMDGTQDLVHYMSPSPSPSHKVSLLQLQLLVSFLCENG